MLEYGLYRCEDDWCPTWTDVLPPLPDVVDALDAEVADTLGCEPADVARLSCQQFSDVFIALCDAPEAGEGYWPTCPHCGAPGQLVRPLVALEV